MRLVKAMLVSAMLLAFLAPPAAAATVRLCNPSDAPVWVDAECYHPWARTYCPTYWQYFWCGYCGDSEGFVNSMDWLLSCAAAADDASALRVVGAA